MHSVYFGNFWRKLFNFKIYNIIKMLHYELWHEKHVFCSKYAIEKWSYISYIEQHFKKRVWQLFKYFWSHSHMFFVCCFNSRKLLPCLLLALLKSLLQSVGIKKTLPRENFRIHVWFGVFHMRIVVIVLNTFEETIFGHMKKCLPARWKHRTQFEITAHRIGK